MKVMLVNAVNNEKGYMNIQNPIGVGYLVSSLRQKFGRDYFDFKYIEGNVEEETRNFGPDVVLMTSVSENYNIAKSYAKTIKEIAPDTPVVIGGIHISLMANTLTKDMDIGVIGEGEKTVCELFENFNNKRFNNLDRINGLIFWKNGSIVRTGERALIEPLDSVPPPERDIFPEIKGITIMTSRGCPYRCIFCSSTRFFKKVRFFSAGYVISELKSLIEKYNPKTIGISDDLFIADKNRLKIISGKIAEEGIDKKVSFYCQCRANLVDDETVKLLKNMNVTSISMGLESGCEKTLKYLKGGSVSVQDNQKAIDIIRKHGIEASAQFIIGSPYETREDILETLEFIKKSGLDYAWIYLLTPLPETPVWEFAKERGIIKDELNFDWSVLKFSLSDNIDRAIILSQTLSREELKELYSLFEAEVDKIKFRHKIKTFKKNPLVVFTKIKQLIVGRPGAIQNARRTRR